MGGEAPALCLIEALTRFIPGVLGNEDSLTDESYSGGLLEYPQYTRPREYNGWEVPEVLFSGNHAEIKEWRDKTALKLTQKHRPDLLNLASAPPVQSAKVVGKKIMKVELKNSKKSFKK